MDDGVRHAPDEPSGGTPPLRRAILHGLRRMGAQTPDRLAAALGSSRSGVLQQLRALESAGLVRREAERHGVGRPRHVYDVTPAAQDAFPSNYDALSAGLLAAIDSLGGPEMVQAAFAARRRGIADGILVRLTDRLAPGATLIDRVRELALIQDEQGYLADAVVIADGTVKLREHNCAIFRVASGHPEACAAELQLFRDVLGADVTRETHIVAGDRCCSYRVTARAEA
ncbi:MAG TPA: helix-turn-helix domain-containing protein [Candidatus Limnocylindrales bacterium]